MEGITTQRERHEGGERALMRRCAEGLDTWAGQRMAEGLPADRCLDMANRITGYWSLQEENDPDSGGVPARPEALTGAHRRETAGGLLHHIQELARTHGIEGAREIMEAASLALELSAADAGAPLAC